MTRHDRLDAAARDHAVAYALDGLSSDEKSAFEAHLGTCEACRNEVDSLRQILGRLATLVPAQAPPPDLKARLMARIRQSPETRETSHQPWKGWTPSAQISGLTLVRAEEGGWEPTGVEGVAVRRLFLDVENDRATMLVRMAPGTSYPAHVHAGAEECFVLEGDLLVGDSRMRAGDYQRATGGSLHGMQSTEGGCLLFIVSSLHDEMLPGGEAHR